MAICQFCNGEMLEVDGCTYNVLELSNGRRAWRIKAGEEDGWIEPGERCNDCGALYGHYHHYGCDVEKCPFCGHQLITCDCPVENLVKAKRKGEKANA